MSAKKSEEIDVTDFQNLITSAPSEQTFTNGKALSEDLTFDPDKFRLPQDFSGEVGVVELLSIPVRKPGKQTWFRVHPGEQYRMNCGVILLDDTRETYLVAPELYPDLAKFLTPVTIYTWVNYHGTPALWPAKLPTGNRRGDRWCKTAHEAAKVAMTEWVQLESLMDSGNYRVVRAPFLRAEPQFPPKSFRELLTLGFKDARIEDKGHPVYKELLGSDV